MFCNLFDSHTHSDNSFDGEHNITFMCESAIAKGLLGLAITDHCDVDFPEQHLEERMRQSYFEVCRARAAFGKSFLLSAGMELGEPDADEVFAEKALHFGRFDFVLGSVHTVENKKDFYYCNFQQEDPYPLLESYWKRLLLLVQWNRHDVLAHLTYPERYMLRDGRMDVDFSRFDERIDECLRLTAQNGKGLEINTSGLRRDGRMMPELRYVKRFRELGGEIITIGSDAHRAEDIGANLADGMELAKEAGFSYFAFFKGRKARMIPIY